MKRRNLLKIAGGSLALTGFGLKTAAAGEAFRWSRAGAAALVGQSFWLNHPQFGAMAITLAGVDLRATNKPDPRLEQFSLVFQAPQANAVLEGTYDMDHPALGRFALHLAPAGNAGDLASYRSDFTLLT